MATVTEKTYTESQESRIADVAEANGGKIDGALAESLAEEFGKTPASVRAKASRMGVYQAKARTSKTGGKPETKEEIAAEIGKLLNANMEGLEAAPKLAIQRIRDFIKAA